MGCAESELCIHHGVRPAPRRTGLPSRVAPRRTLSAQASTPAHADFTWDPASRILAPVEDTVEDRIGGFFLQEVATAMGQTCRRARRKLSIAIVTRRVGQWASNDAVVNAKYDVTA